MRYTESVEVETNQQGDATSRYDPTSPDMSRHTATGSDDYISLKEAREIFLAHKRPVSERTLQRSCVKGHIDGKKLVTDEGEKWFALRSSVLNRIAELAKFDELRERPVAARRDVSRPDAEKNQRDISDDNLRQGSTEDVSQPVVSPQESHSTPSATSRHDATGRDTSPELKEIKDLYEKLIAVYQDQATEYKKDKSSLQADKEALIRQLEAKDAQITRFFKTETETKTLFGRMTTLINGIWPNKVPGDHYVPATEALESGLEHLQDDEPR